MPFIRPGEFVEDDDLITRVDDADPTNTYFGQSKPGNGNTAGYARDEWRIWIIDSSGNKLKADGIKGFYKVWNDRTGYEYK